jgi:hypothetical protein
MVVAIFGKAIPLEQIACSSRFRELKFATTGV